MQHQRKTTLAASALALALSAGAAPAQQAFDLILPTSVSVAEDGALGPLGSTAGFGGLVNTGTVGLGVDTLLLQNWELDSRICARSQAPWVPFSLSTNLGTKFAFGLGTGAAFGELTPDMEALLGPQEFLATATIGALSPAFELTIFDAPPVGAPPVTLDCLLMSQWTEPSVAERLVVRFELEVQTVPGSVSSVSGAQRVSAIAEPDATWTINVGCGPMFPGFADTVEIAGGNSSISELSRNCSLPVPGTALSLSPGIAFESAYLGAPWLLALSVPGTGPAFTELLGCNVLTPSANLIPFSIGSYPGPSTLSLPIPDNAALLGAILDAQWAVFSDAAPNGLFDSSRALRLTVSTF